MFFLAARRRGFVCGRHGIIGFASWTLFIVGAKRHHFRLNYLGPRRLLFTEVLVNILPELCR